MPILDEKLPPARGEGQPSQRGCVWLLGAGPGDPELITWRGVLLLQEADVVLHDALSHPELLELCPQAEVVDVGKRFGQRATPQDLITSRLIELAQAGKRVVRLKGGDPLMFARGSEEALALAAAEIPFEIVPGVTSPIAASAYAGIPLTHREASSSVTFITGSDRKGKEWSPEAWKKLATATGTICVLMGMRRLGEIAQAVVDGGRSKDTPVAVVRWGARPQQQTVVGTLESIKEKSDEAGLKSPAIIIVGEVVKLREELRWYDTQPLFGKRILIPRPLHQGRATARVLRARGAVPLLCPAIEILPSPNPAALKEAVAQAGSYDWIVFTSSNGVDAFFREVDALGLDSRIFAAAKIAVIGPKTGDSLTNRGIRADLVARKFVAESLVKALLDQSPPPQRVLIPRAAEAREVLPEALKKAGISVDVVPAYLTRPVQGEEAEALYDRVKRDAEIILLTSSSMVDSLVQALGTEARELLSKKTLACIGPITAATARAHGLSVGVDSPVHTVPALVAELEKHFESKSPE